MARLLARRCWRRPWCCRRAVSDDDGGAAPAPPQPPAAAPADFPSAHGKTLDELTPSLHAGRDPQRLERHARSSPARQPPRLRDRRPREQADRRLRGRRLHRQARRHASCAGRSSRARSRSTSRRRIAARRRRRTSPAATRSTSPTPSYGSRGRARRDRARAPRRPARRRRRRRRAARSARRTARRDVGDARDQGPHARPAPTSAATSTKLSTRVPPPPRDARAPTSPTSLGKKPVVLLFATPALCQSRTCGPVVDIAEQVRAQNGKGVTFIQQEIYQDNDPGKPVPPAGRWPGACRPSRGRSSSTATARSPRASRASSRSASSRAPSSA